MQLIQKKLFLNTAKYTPIALVVLLTILAIGSCAKKPLPEPDVMNFTLTKEGSEVDINSPLSRGSTYRLTINAGADAVVTNENYDIFYLPTTAITVVSKNVNSIEFTVNRATTATTLTFTITHKEDSTITDTLTLSITLRTIFQQNIENATTVPNLATADALTREVLTPLGVATGTTLEKRYVTESGGATTQDGNSWATAWTGASLRNNINSIGDASTSKVYLVMVAGGTYKPTTTTTRTDSFSMKNHVAIMGGFDPAGGWDRTGTTIFSGDIGAAGNNGDNSYHVFNHTSITLDNAHLYGVTITGGNANGGTAALQRGGGMYNSASSPVLTEVIFSGNSSYNGGGMFNDNASSPVLTEATFSGNSSQQGGGMFNNNASSPVLTSVVFSGNTANNFGGGMYNNASSPVLTSVVFSGNTAANNDGGGIYNLNSSSPVIIGAVFENNRAANGGGLLIDNHSGSVYLIVNTIFSGNTLIGGGSGPDIGVDNNASTANVQIRIAGSVLGIGGGSAITGIVGYSSGGGTGAMNITHHSLANGAVRFGADATTGGLTYPTITTGSSAINRGLYVRKNGTTYYFSETEAVTSWHTSFTSAGGLAGTPAALPTTGTTEDLTATDIAGNARNGRPDAGVYELP